MACHFQPSTSVRLQCALQGSSSNVQELRQTPGTFRCNLTLPLPAPCLSSNFRFSSSPSLSGSKRLTPTWPTPLKLTASRLECTAIATPGPDGKEQKTHRQPSTTAEAASTSVFAQDQVACSAGQPDEPAASPKAGLEGLALSSREANLVQALLTREQEMDNPPRGMLARFNHFLESKFSPRVRGLILLNILTFLYGSNVTVVKEAQATLDPFSFSFGRFSIAAVVFVPFLERALRSPPLRRAGIELGIWASLAYVTQSVGLMTTEAGRASFIGTFTVIEVPIIAGLFGAKIPMVTWWSAAAAVLGVGLLESGGNSTPMGDFWTILSALLFGFHMLRSEHHARHVPQDGALSLISLQLAVTALMSSLWLLGMTQLGLVSGDTVGALSRLDWEALSQWPWWQMAYTGVLSTAFCLWVEVVSLRDVSATEAAMVYTLEPLYGAAFAWFLLGERWGPLGWVGAALILGGSLSMQLLGRVEVAEDKPEEIEAQMSSAAILAALAAATAIAMVMVATGGVPGLGIGPDDAVLSEGLTRAEIAAVSSKVSEDEIDNLTVFMRVYAMVKGDHGAEGDWTKQD